ncbi:hypothetical protein METBISCDRAFT_30726 [Metschnikowia bicuspidata]|uniref:DNA-directed RNA polymerase subunit n=1 Tax=Metschnikowia bicuspidata TaxID=27322 RepID=A0A4P9ZCM6_9ASCO|nr:hypothetical protein METBISCDRAFT_30726 [Metschnikowia bicuspidata]
MADIQTNGVGADYGRQKTQKPPRSTNSTSEDGISECFRVARTSMYVSLAPFHIENPIDGIKSQHLDPLVMKYFPKANGVVLGYSNIMIKEDDRVPEGETNEIMVTVSDLSPFAFMWISVDLLLWSPQIGDTLKGYIFMLTATHLGLLVHDTFNAHIKSRFIPQSWKFAPNQADEYNDSEPSEDQRRSHFRSYGYWVDHTGIKVEGKIAFTVRAINTSCKMISLEGTLVSPESELDAQPVHESFDEELEKQAPVAAKPQENGIPTYVADSNSSDSD